MDRRAGGLPAAMAGAPLLLALVTLLGWGGGFARAESLTWGIQSACAGCSHVTGHVTEYPDREVLSVECSCPANEGGCTCASEFRWFWNLQCAKNISMRLENGCGGSAAFHVVAGNVTGETIMVDLLETCGGGGGGLCEVSLDRYLWSTRLVEVEITMPAACPQEQRAVWELPIASDLKCTSVEEIKQRIEKVDAPQLVTICVMLVLGVFVGVVLCRKNRRPSFEDKPSRYFSHLEKDGEGTEMR